MGKPKAQAKKQQKRGGIDFKKIKRKVGRKLPPPKNATNTEIKSKAIILPEQSVVSEKTGLAVSKKGLTLKELLQQTSHHNAKVRKDALVGIKDIFVKYPTELKLHKLATVEKLRERISDDDKFVRETLYQLFKSVIFPGCKEDNQGPLIPLMVAYIFNSMTHLALDVRLMAFKFLDLLVQQYPSSFSLYAEKILQNYHDILQKSQFHFQDKSKLKGILAGLVHCLRMLPSNKRDDQSSSETEVPSRGILHAFEPDENVDSSDLSGTIEKLKNLLPILVSCFEDFIPSNHTMPQLDTQSYDCMLFILQSINYMVEFFVYENGKPEQGGDGILPISGGERNAVMLAQIVSPAIFKKIWNLFPLNSAHTHLEKEDDRYSILNCIITEIFLQLKDWTSLPPALFENFLEFIESSLSQKSYSCSRSGKVYLEKHLLPIVPFIPNLIMQVPGGWRHRLLQAFTDIFRSCGAESDMKSTCLSALEEMLNPEKGGFFLVSTDPEMLDYHLTWIRELPQLLLLLGDRNTSRSKAVLCLLLLIGKAAIMNNSVSQVYDQVQYALAEFYSNCLDETASTSYGPFMKLSRDTQELSLSCVYYFSFVDYPLLQSMVTCCLCEDLDPVLLLRIIEVLHLAYKAGNISNGDYISFLITLLSRFKVSPEDCLSATEEVILRRSTFRSITRVICSYLSQIGDGHLVLQILEKPVVDQMSLKLPLDNICAFLRVLVTLDCKPTILCEQSIIRLSDVLLGYLSKIAISMQHDDSGATVSRSDSLYYLLPSFFLFDRSSTLLNQFLISMRSMVDKSLLPHHPRQASYKTNGANWNAVVSVLLLMLEDVKMQKNLWPQKSLIEEILQRVLVLMSEDIYLPIEERHKLKRGCDQLRSIISR
ncbi:OLC1v1034076C1 [Oldenlandia corymbosa var. corymbosa]|uniref:OLC1v1034076C1 n=1 Tax=Oldenlandia corymbosa var. corymbosa TaxID=529605 RepID=A0AAV1CRC6_OLDCO|nr:OLC1v1034076C1 [Oldenlandia corymbosa var. corymbosa]